MKHGFVKVAAVSCEMRVADVKFNTAKIIQAIWDSETAGTKVLVLPELCVTGASCGDLFLQRTLIDAAHSAILDIADACHGKQITVFVGAPLYNNGHLFNCAVAIADGRILGVVPKGAVASFGAIYETRYFAEPTSESQIKIGDIYYPFGKDLIFECMEMPSLKIGVELGEDLMSVSSHAATLAACGATVIACPMAVPCLVGSEEKISLMARAKSAMLRCAYIISTPCEHESTTDMIYAPHNIICENGDVLAKFTPFSNTVCNISTELDLFALENARSRDNTFKAVDPTDSLILYGMKMDKMTALTRYVDRHPFVCDDVAQAGARYERILTMQAHALAKRLVSSHSQSAVMGISGGLDSTLGMLAVLRAMDFLGWDRERFHCISMPCFGTSSRTKSNAQALCELCGVSFREIDISEAVRVHFADIGHSEDDFSVAYENAQARERTQILMDFANKVGGLVVGTGDLSEIALGWSTYNADHMSMYNPNCDIPKTLVRALVDYEGTRLGGELQAVLCDILGTPVSPELLPPDKAGKIAQKTEDLVGPYELHDFFLYHFMKGDVPSKIYRLAKYAFDGEYDDYTIYKWLQKFISRFFSQQFKRSCSPDGVKIGSVALSPRGDLKMPSDASPWVWLDELESNK